MDGKIGGFTGRAGYDMGLSAKVEARLCGPRGGLPKTAGPCLTWTRMLSIPYAGKYASA